jgi:hypothetical protein
MPELNDEISLRHNTAVRLFGSDGRPKLLWNENALGRSLRRAGFEIRIPFLTGHYDEVLRSHNLITNVGHAAANARMSGQGSYGTFVNLAIGTGTTAAAAGDTALQAEITTGGGARGAATATQVTTTVANDTTQIVKTWTFTSAFAVTEEGILDNATSGGNLLAHQVWAVINVASGDQLTVTHKYST